MRLQHGHKLTCPLTLTPLRMAPGPPNGTDPDCELATRLERDRGRFAAVFGQSWPAGRPALTPAGDPHLGGRRVTRVACGPRSVLVYKPRPMLTDTIWQRTVAWLFRQAGQGSPLLPRTLVRQAYGWVERVETRRPSGPAEARLYHRRAGLLLALFDVLEVRDVHRDNLLAAGSHPVLVDAETIAHPRLTPFRNTPSIIQCGFFPGPEAGDDRAGCHSGLPARATPLSRFEDELLEGYQTGYRLLAAHGGGLFRGRGPLRPLPEAAVRVVLRPTTLYRAALRGPDPAGLLDAAGALPLPARHRSAVVRAERADLAQGDVPIFHARGDGTGLLSAGRVIAPGCFPESGVGTVADRLARLSPRNQRENVDLIRAMIRLHALNAGRDKAARDRSGRRSRSR